MSDTTTPPATPIPTTTPPAQVCPLPQSPLQPTTAKAGSPLAPALAPGVQLDQASNFPTDPNGPENPIHSLDVFSRGLPVDERFVFGFRKRQTEVEMTFPAMRQVMLGIDMRPHTLVMNPRAHLFPDKIESVVFQTKSSLFDLLLQQVGEFEAFNRRTLSQPFSYGEVHDVQKVGKNDSFIPYGFWKGKCNFLGSEVWQVRRRDRRADALVWYLEQKKLGKIDNPPTQAELDALPTQEQMQFYRYLSDFGTIDIDDYPVEEQQSIISKFKKQQYAFPFVKTNYYRINYYSEPAGDFFFSDVLPDERSDARQWAEWTWIKTAQWTKRVFGGKESAPKPALDLTLKSGQLV